MEMKITLLSQCILSQTSMRGFPNTVYFDGRNGETQGTPSGHCNYGGIVLLKMGGIVK